jgi:hypothetical protein
MRWAADGNSNSYNKDALKGLPLTAALVVSGSLARTDALVINRTSNVAVTAPTLVTPKLVI